MFFEGYTEKLWGRHPSQISADWGAQRVKGLSITEVLENAFLKLLPKKQDASKVETSLIEEFWYPKYGPGQLWETVERNCERAGVRVITDANVVQVRQEGGRIESVVYEDCEGNRTELKADQFISSMPVKDLVNALGGAVIGLSEGALVLFLAIWVLRRFGVSFETDTVSATHILRFFATHTPLSALSFLQ